MISLKLGISSRVKQILTLRHIRGKRLTNAQTGQVKSLRESSTGVRPVPQLLSNSFFNTGMFTVFIKIKQSESGAELWQRFSAIHIVHARKSVT